MTGAPHQLPPPWNALRDWAEEQADLTLVPGQLDQLRAHLDTLLVWNRRMALVSQRDPQQIVDKHFADSLFAAAHCADGESVVDLGSGAGFPGLPIAVVRPASSVGLIESRGKKATFLEEARRAAKVRNSTICHARIEVLARLDEHRARYDVATARALTTVPDFLELARPFLAPGGRAIAMRSITEPTDNLTGVDEIPYTLPDGTPRRLLVVHF